MYVGFFPDENSESSRQELVFYKQWCKQLHREILLQENVFKYFWEISS